MREKQAEKLIKLIARLKEENDRYPVIVEGRKDEKALRRIGLFGIILRLDQGDSIFNLCEALREDHEKVLILTDWDRRGGRLARALREGLKANGISYDDDFRRQIAFLVRKEVKDVEGLPKLLSKLSGSAPNRRTKRND
ncbi:MAG: toprim domain-containing protein [Thermoplasmata archaeon]